MQNRKFITGMLSVLALGTMFAQNINNNQAAVEKMIQREYDRMISLLNDEEDLRAQINWDALFKAIDKYKINPATLKYKSGGGRISFLELAIRVNTMNPKFGGSEKRQKESFRAVKTLLEKYHIFRGKPCGGDNCDKLVAVALQGFPHDLAIVDLLLKHGAKLNKKTVQNIKNVYKGGNYPHIKALIKK
jgi:hypothetical protein